MPLAQGTRAEVMHQLASLASQVGPLGLTKPDLLAAVAAVDDFLETNATAINNAIPQPARSLLPTPLKAALVAYVALRRWGGS